LHPRTSLGPNAGLVLSLLVDSGVSCLFTERRKPLVRGSIRPVMRASVIKEVFRKERGTEVPPCPGAIPPTLPRTSRSSASPPTSWVSKPWIHCPHQESQSRLITDTSIPMSSCGGSDAMATMRDLDRGWARSPEISPFRVITPQSAWHPFFPLPENSSLIDL
jgi:hypothetical protein